MPPVFISYAKEDSATAKAVARELRALGRSTWLFEEDGAGGVSYVEDLCGPLSTSCGVVLIASKASLRSRNIRKEVELAHQEDRVLIPVVLDVTVEELRAAHDIFKFVIGTTVPLNGQGVSARELAGQIDTALRRHGGNDPAPPPVSEAFTAAGRAPVTDDWWKDFLHTKKSLEEEIIETTCLRCNGTGKWASVQKPGKWNTCKQCNGTGLWKHPKPPRPLTRFRLDDK
jgi:hypothetical protein